MHKGKVCTRVAAAALALALLAPAAWAVPTVNGLFFGDDDYQQYLLLGNDTTGGSKGKIYYYLAGNTMYIALVVGKSAANDAVFGTKSMDGPYMNSANWSATHTFQRLYGSDHATFGIECGATASTPDWGFAMDLLHDTDGDADPNEADFFGGPTGTDGSITALPPAFVSNTSIAWNMNNTLWDVTLGATRTTINDYKSPDQGTIGDITDDSYSLLDDTTKANNWNDTVKWEWTLVYEFSFSVATCTTDLSINPGTSHNSPSKDGDENTTYPPPPPIVTTYASISEFGAFVAPSGDVVVEWQTDLEVGTVGFYLERLGPESEEWVPVGNGLAPALITSPQGGTYRLRDRDAAPGVEYAYRLIEVENNGAEREYGPFVVTPEWRMPGKSGNAASVEFEAVPHGLRGRSWLPPGQAKKAASGKAQGQKASGPVQLRVGVTEDGLVQVSADDLAAAFGLPGKSVRGQLTAGRFRVTSGGEEVAWAPAPGNTGLVFYGEAIDSLYTTENVYWITAERGTTMDHVSGSAPAASPGGSYVATEDLEQDLFAATAASRDAEADYWYWGGVFDDSASARNWTLEVTVPDALDGYELAADLVGATTADHPMQISLNGTPVANGSGSGLERFTLAGSLPVGLLHVGKNTIRVSALSAPGQNVVYIDGFRLSYERPLTAVGDRLHFTADGGTTTVDGFSSSDIRVFDVTDPRRPVSIDAIRVDGSGSGFRVTFDAVGGGSYFAAAGGTVTLAAPVVTPQAVITASGGGAAEYLLITSPELAAAAEDLAEYRRRSGYGVRLVTTDEIYRAMSHGIATPHAIRDFLAWSRDHWGVEYVALVGMASYDYRGLLAPGENIVPTMMTGTPYGLFACDVCLADENGDGAPETAVGRVPVASAAELAAFVAKLATYEGGSTLGTQGAVLLLADRYGSAGDFAMDSDHFADQLPSAYQSSVERIFVDDQAFPNTVGQQTRDRINAGGVGWVNYTGHGGMTQLGGTPSTRFLFRGDSAALSNGSDLPIVTALSCAANRFEFAGFDSLGEELVLDPDGGAIAVFAPTGLSLNGAASPMGQALAAVVFDEGAYTLGDAIVAATQRVADSNLPFVLKVYSLVGDPATRLR